jgi:FixJ family two-component response regulator
VNRTGEMIYVIEDDSRRRDELLHFLSSNESEALGFKSASDFLAYGRTDTCACLIVEMDMHDTNGLELQRQLAARLSPPIIFVSESGNVRLTVDAMKAGAIEFLTWPIDTAALKRAIDTALERDRLLRHRRACRARLQERFSSLTPRQRQVFPLIIGGLLNKQAASLLDISEVTLQIHRSQIMRKMAADSFAELVRMAVELRIPHWQHSANER